MKIRMVDDSIVDRCIEHKLTLCAYYILYLIYNENSDKLTHYCRDVELIETKSFTMLVYGGWIEELKDRKNIRIEDLKLTDKFKSEILKIVDVKGITFDDCFEQLREHYPSKAGNTERRLQSDIHRCRILYTNIITKNGKIDEELHSMILQCINYEIKLKTKDRSLNYLQLLPTWLQQKSYELYYKDVEEIIKKKGFVDKPNHGDSDEGENKTKLGSEDF